MADVVQWRAQVQAGSRGSYLRVPADLTLREVLGPWADIAAKGPERRLAACAEHPLAEAVNG